MSTPVVPSDPPRPPHTIERPTPSEPNPSHVVNGPPNGSSNGVSNGIANGDAPSTQQWFSRACADVQASLTKEVHSTNSDKALFAVYQKASLLWDVGQEIRYSFLKGDYQGNQIQQAKVSSVLPEWERYANIKFILVEDKGDIRITFNGNDGSWSYTGTRSLEIDYEKATMNLGWIGKAKDKLTVEERGTILHEFGHALGLLHEHQSPSRQVELALNEDAVYEFYTKSQGWSRDLVKSQIIDTYNTRDLSNYSELDTKSIMMYFMPAEMNKLGKEIPPNNKLSDLDVAYTILNYPPANLKGSDPQVGDWTLSRALKVAGVSPVSRAEILKTEDPEDIRALFSKWNAHMTANRDLGAKRTVSIPGTLTPAHDISNPTPSKEDAIQATSGNFLDEIAKSFRKFFAPGGGQFLTVQFPGRFLQMSQYSWDTSSAGIYGQFIKPTVVNESEFRLVDQLYDPAGVVSAPNGQSLSQIYEQLLNNLVPKSSSSKALAEQQRKLRRWLLGDAKVSGWVEELIANQYKKQKSTISGPSQGLRLPSSDREINLPEGAAAYPQPSFTVHKRLNNDKKTVNRLELSNALMKDYLEAKQAWELERDRLTREALKMKIGTDESRTALNDLTRTLSHITAIHEAELAAKYTDAVVRGYSHEVSEYVGYLDLKSSAEILQEAKTALRESQASSMDGSLKVYPVQMSPIDWFEGLSTSFTIEDLTQNPELIENQIRAKSQLIDTLNSQLVALQHGTSGDVEKLLKEVESARSDFDASQANLAKQYSASTLAMARTCYNAVGKLNSLQLKAVMKQQGMLDDAINALSVELDKVETSQTKLNNATRAYSTVSANLAFAKASDTRQQQEQIRMKIESTSREIRELTARYQILNPGLEERRPEAKANTSINQFNLFPENKSETAGGSRWQDFQFRHSVSSDYSQHSDSTTNRTSSKMCNLWFTSSSSSSSSTSSTSSTISGQSEHEVVIGFRATLVTVDRAGWFRPQFFSQSGAYYHVNSGISWNKWPAGIDNEEELKAKDALKNLKGLLPSFPVGFIVCKDITIKIKNSSSSASTSKSNLEEHASSSRGILCFSYESTSSNHSQNENSSSVFNCSDGCVIRIPGPQILGYIQQLTKSDASEDMPASLPKDFFVFPDEEEADEKERKPQHGVHSGESGGQPAKPELLGDKINEVLRNLNVSEEIRDKVHQAMAHEIGIISKDEADKVTTV